MIGYAKDNSNDFNHITFVLGMDGMNTWTFGQLKLVVLQQIQLCCSLWNVKFEKPEKYQYI